MTDLMRDERRNGRLLTWVFRVADYLEGKGGIEAVHDAAAACDRVPRGYWHGITAMRQYTALVLAAARGDRDAIGKLRAVVDPEHWAVGRYLAALGERERESDDGERD